MCEQIQVFHVSCLQRLLLQRPMQVLKHVFINIHTCNDTYRVTFNQNTAPMGEHVALYGDIVIEGLSLRFGSCNSFVFSPPEPCDDPPPSNTDISRYVSGGGKCTWEPVPGLLPTECKCHQDAQINIVTGLCRCLPGFYGNGKSFCYTVKEPSFTLINVLGDSQVIPASRIGHTMAADDAYAVWIFGGELESGVLAGADLYKLDTARYVPLRDDYKYMILQGLHLWCMHTFFCITFQNTV
jgi:hypothetical protein